MIYPPKNSKKQIEQKFKLSHTDNWDQFIKCITKTDPKSDCYLKLKSDGFSNLTRHFLTAQNHKFPKHLKRHNQNPSAKNRNIHFIGLTSEVDGEIKLTERIEDKEEEEYRCDPLCTDNESDFDVKKEAIFALNHRGND